MVRLEPNNLATEQRRLAPLRVALILGRGGLNMKVETTIVTVGETPKDKCPTYEKRTAETIADAFSVLPGIQLSPDQVTSITKLDSLFPIATIKGKDGKDETVPNPFREAFLGHFNYGFDLYQKAKTRRDFEKTLEDPSKPVVAAVKGMVASGFEADMAYDLVLAQRTAKGMETPSKESILAKLK